MVFPCASGGSGMWVGVVGCSRRDMEREEEGGRGRERQTTMGQGKTVAILMKSGRVFSVFTVIYLRMCV